MQMRPRQLRRAAFASTGTCSYQTLLSVNGCWISINQECPATKRVSVTLRTSAKIRGPNSVVRSQRPPRLSYGPRTTDYGPRTTDHGQRIAVFPSVLYKFTANPIVTLKRN